MVTIQKNPHPDEVRQSARHTLFVEGKDKEAIDPKVLSKLLLDITVKPLGSSYHIRSVADALYKYHPNYYFLIDRDHYDDSIVNTYWEKFPDPNTSNLLIWHRRELENYFIIPEYIKYSQYICVSVDQLKKTVLDCSQRRLYFDAANQVIIQIREILKKNWITVFDKVEEFQSKDNAIIKLSEKKEFNTKIDSDKKQLEQKEILETFEKILELWSGGKKKLEYGQGLWLERLRGKEILPTVINHCFKVRDASDKLLQGKQKMIEVVKDLIPKDIPERPDDFQKLHTIISERIKTT